MALPPTHISWLDDHLRDLLDFGLRCPAPGGGAGYLDERGQLDASMGVQTWITSRMVHVYSMGAMLGVPGARAVAQRAMAGLTGPLRDVAGGGWWHAVDADGKPDAEAGKQCYDHAFVLLAASSAAHAELDGAESLLREAAETYERWFWDDEAGLPVDLWDANFQHADPYRGLNGAMHSVEAMLAAADATGDVRWRERAVRVGQFAVYLSGTNDARLPEHFDEEWNALPDYNRDRPDDQFKPFGATVGHGFEWARLLVHVAASLGDEGLTGFDEAAIALFDRATSDGFVDGEHPGFVYTTDFDGQPVVTQRMHWVVAEAIGAADVLARRTGERHYRELYERWWDVARLHFIDDELGSWHHQVDEQNRPQGDVWPGKPDIYHAAQATLIPRVALESSLAAGVKRELGWTP